MKQYVVLHSRRRLGQVGDVISLTDKQAELYLGLKLVELLQGKVDNDNIEQRSDTLS